jgi:sugar/nucleoside kinase (ribokinase family)
MSTQSEAIVAGHLCLDVIPDLSATRAELFLRTFVPGRLLEVGAAALSTGGAVSNVGLALHRLGVGAQLMGKIGRDLFGQAIAQVVASFDPQLAAGMIVDDAAISSYTVVINPPGIDRIFLHCPGANDTFGAEDIRYDLLAGARLFHFGYPPLMRRMYQDNGRELVEIFRRARAAGVTTCLDMALPDPGSAAGRADWQEILRATLPYVDIFLPSIEETLYALRRPTYERLHGAAADHNIVPLVTPDLLSDVSGELLALGVKAVGLKLGHRGLYVRTAGEAAWLDAGRGRPADLAGWVDKELWAPCFQVDVVGATGSGDATIAGFLAALLRGLNAEQAVTMAVAVGACNIEAADALSGIRSWEETQARVAGGWPRHAMHLDAAGWRCDAPTGLWLGPTQANPPGVGREV